MPMVVLGFKLFSCKVWKDIELPCWVGKEHGVSLHALEHKMSFSRYYWAQKAVQQHKTATQFSHHQCNRKENFKQKLNCYMQKRLKV